MKVLLFTHKNDIDGMGSAVLAKLAFSEVTYILCEKVDLEKQMDKFIEDNTIYLYDLVLVADIPPTEQLLKKLQSLSKLNKKLFIFDHHLSSIQDIKGKYDFLYVTIKNQEGLCSGTSLVYDFLILNKYLPSDNKLILEFKELTRKYDTWEWKTIYHDNTPRELTLLFDSVSRDTYIDLMVEKLKKKTSKFRFTKSEKMIIENRQKLTEEKLNYYLNHLSYRELKGYKVIIAFINYEFRNDLADYLRDNNYQADVVILVSLDNNTISYRTINPLVSANTFAKFFQGGGHDKAAGSAISSSSLSSIIDILFKD